MNIITTILQLIYIIPNPWSPSVFILLASIVVYLGLRIIKFALPYLCRILMKITEIITFVFLLPEYIFTVILRQLKVQTIPFANWYDEAVVGVGKSICKVLEILLRIETMKLSYPIGWIFLLVITPPILGLLNTQMEIRHSSFGNLIDKAFGLYNDFLLNVIL